MKTNFFRIVMPATAILLAIGGSFASQASGKKTTANVPGYIIPIGGNVCENRTICSNITSPVLCTVIYQGISYQAFAKQSGSDTVCDITLWKPVP